MMLWPALAPLAFLDGIGFSEMLVIAFVSVLVFGDRLPEVMRNLGRTYANFRRSLSEVSRPIRDEIRRVTTLPPEITHPLLPSVTPPRVTAGSIVDVQPLPNPPPVRSEGQPLSTHPANVTPPAPAPLAGGIPPAPPAIPPMDAAPDTDDTPFV